MTKDMSELDNFCKNLQLFMQHKDKLGPNFDIASYEAMIRQSLKRILKLTLGFSNNGLLTDPSIDLITSNLYNMYKSSNIDESAIHIELADLISKLPMSVPAPSARTNRVPADEVDPTNNQENKRRQKLKRKKTVETYDDQSTDESEDDQCPQLPLPSAGPDVLEQLREQERVRHAINQIAKKTKTIEKSGETMRKGESMMEIDETKKLVSKNWVDFLVENEEFEAAAKHVKTNRDNAQAFDDVTLPRYGKEAEKPKKKDKKSKKDSSPKKSKQSKDKKGKKKGRPLPVESDAVSEGDLFDEEEAGVPSAKPPKLNGKKSKSPKKGKKADKKSKKGKSGKSSAADASGTETDATEKSPSKKAKKGKKRKLPETETDITVTETDATEPSPKKKGKKKAARKIKGSQPAETSPMSATETEAVTSDAVTTDVTEASPSKKKVRKPLISPEDAQAENEVHNKMQHLDSMLNQSGNVSHKTSNTSNFPMIQAQLEMPQGPELNPQPSVHSVQSSFGGPIDSMDIIYDKYIEILGNHCNDMAEYVTVTTTNFISSVYEVLPPLEQRMNLLLRRIDILERILDTEKTTLDLKPGKSIQRGELDEATSLHNKPSWVRAFEK